MIFPIAYRVAIYMNPFFFDLGNKSLPVQSKSQHIHWIAGKKEDTEKDECHALLLLSQSQDALFAIAVAVTFSSSRLVENTEREFLV